MEQASVGSDRARHRKAGRLDLAKMEKFWLDVMDPTYYIGLRRICPQSTLRCETERAAYPRPRGGAQPGAE